LHASDRWHGARAASAGCRGKFADRAFRRPEIGTKAPTSALAPANPVQSRSSPADAPARSVPLAERNAKSARSCRPGAVCSRLQRRLAATRHRW